MPAQRQYPVEPRERATQRAIDARKNPATRTGECRRIGEHLGVNPEALRIRVSRAEIDESLRPGTTTADIDRITELEREVRGLHRANTILKQARLFAFRVHSPGSSSGRR
ncbi:hypothetical protein FCN77_11375 [Arthrobacter sp. 24S4-2]|uniref:hypothetical protein n=1 Tax=Arthrobacter sp. 24S4-2 TaxID=2575374 RepID=UPI0010C7BB11|nr:hypothetical protein [Arthrobacter sp. 24S4-2]QCO98191.1 hypothetical protein FCN77_11375 [Arthrobacter sp. 24S4-2]